MNKFIRLTILLICGLIPLNIFATAYTFGDGTSDSLNEVPKGPAPGTALLPFDSVAFFYSQTITAAELFEHLNVLASDEYMGRETAREGQYKSAAYIEEYLVGLGVDPISTGSGTKGYFQNFNVVEHKWGKSWVQLGNHRFEFLKDYYAYLNSNESLRLKTEELLFLGYGIDTSMYSDYEGVETGGKIAVILTGEPMNDELSIITGTNEKSAWSSNWRKKLKCAKEHGVELLLIIDKNAEARLGSKNFVHYMESSSMDLASEKKENPFVPNLYISPLLLDSLLGKKADKFRNKIKKAAQKGEPLSANWEMPCEVGIEKVRTELTTQNVLAYIPGSDPALANQLIVLTAHYDHMGVSDDGVYNGADDDGSGTVALMEIAEALELARKNGHGTRRSVLIMPVSAEEKGLLGSEYYAENPVFPLENTVANLNIDMIGRVDNNHASDSDYVYIIGSNMLSTELHDLSEQVAATYSELSLDYKYNSLDDPNRYYYRSDHYNFAKNNIPVIFYFNGTHDDYHRQTDTIEKIVFPLLEKRTRLVFFTLWELANRTNRLTLDVE